MRLRPIRTSRPAAEQLPAVADRSYTSAMPMYEFRCRTCGDTYTEQRPMAQSSAASTCPSGHPDTVRLLSVAGALTGASGVADVADVQPSGGGCCGGGCCA